MNCVKCGKSADSGKKYTFRVLEVRTLPVRDLDREKKVQALGDFKDYCVCESCAAERLRQDTNVVSAKKKTFMGFGAILAAGILVALWALFGTMPFENGRLVFTLLSLAAVFCGAAGIVSAFSEGSARARELAEMKPDRALYASAWECLKDGAPGKAGDANLTYIPVDAATMNRKNGDLMILYKLLPEIAVEAYERIHKDYQEQRP
ncbi:MAG: hypothetical protein K6E30_08300 [Lachnospiraceae bacterium]|nr:hypothetical protein [Lachnospiraceae bacterium]